MHSALKREGTPLYRLARRGEEVERAPRRVRIRSWSCIELEGADAGAAGASAARAPTSASLAEDIGAALGCGAHLAALRRTASGRFRIEEAADAGGAGGRRPSASARLLPLPALLEGLPRAELGAAEEARLRQGQTLQISGLQRRAVRAWCGPTAPSSAWAAPTATARCRPAAADPSG